MSSPSLLSTETKPFPSSSSFPFPSPSPSQSPSSSSSSSSSFSSFPPRLMIKSLTLENFKSYGGLVHVGPFHKSFSAIVGPNGSGKSNVIDAMLFVFGKRAKQMRLSKLAELIHHSERFPDMNECTVTVDFHEIVDTGNGETDYVVVQGSDLVISRTAYKNSSSKYTVNGKTSSFGEVTTLLKTKGVDLENNRFLILQGEVEQISMMKPKGQNEHEDGLLEYLEDIIGSNQYIKNIEEAAKELDTLNEERAHKLNRLKAVEKERAGLENAKTEALDYLKTEKDVLKKKTKLYGHEIASRTGASASLEEQKEQLKAELEQNRIHLEQGQAKLNDFDKQYQVHIREYDQLTDALEKNKADFSAFERKYIKLQEDQKHSKAKEKKIMASIQKEEASIESNTQEIEKKRAVLEADRQLLKELETDLQKSEAALNVEYEKIKGATAPLRLQLEEKQTQMLPLSEKVNENQHNFDVLKAEIDMLQSRINEPKTQLAQALQQIKDYNNELQIIDARYFEFEKRYDQQRNHVLEIEASAQAFRESLRLETSRALDLRKKVEEFKAAASTANSKSRLEAAMNKACAEGLLMGVVGRLGNFGAIDAKYDIAIGAAAGSTLDNIVVQTASDATRCVEFLRQNNLGKATFIILEKMQYLEKAIAEYEARPVPNAQRLFDLIQYNDSSLRCAFYFAVRNTLVAKNLDEGSRLAYQPTRRNRVVTLSGQLIDTSGTMTGGGTAPPKGGLGSSIVVAYNADEAKKAKEDYEACLVNIEKLKSQLSHCEKELAKLKEKASLQASQLEMKKLSMNKQSMAERLQELTQRIPELEKAAAASNANSSEHATVKKLNDDLKRNEKLLETSKQACTGLENEIQKLQDKILQASGVRFESVKERVEQISSKIQDKKTAIAKLETMTENSEKAIQKSKSSLEKFMAEVENLQKEKDSRKDLYKEVEDEALQAKTRMNEAQQAKEEKEKKLSSIKEEHDSLKKSLTEIRKAEVSTNHKLEKILKNLNEILKDISRFKELIKELNQEAERINSEYCIEDPPSADAGEREQDANSMEIDTDNTKYHLLDENQAVELQNTIITLEEALLKMKPNLGAIQEYRAKDQEYNEKFNDLEAVTAQRDAIRKKHDDLKTQRLDDFMRGFSVISTKLKEMYQMITLGGDAELELVDSLDPFSEGIVFSVRPPKKSWKNISNLSGGEKTLSSLALVFALHYYRPTPLYFMDEIDAALDFKNVSIVANYVKERTKNAQFIIISLRNNMFELADRLVGIYKTENVTKSVTINPDSFVKSAVSLEKNSLLV